jgi:hypothetical protein
MSIELWFVDKKYVIINVDVGKTKKYVIINVDVGKINKHIFIL